MPTFGSVDRPRASAIIITAGGNVYNLDNIEQFQTSKNDKGDAGTFTLSMPTKLAIAVAQEIKPMDLIAIFRGRVSTNFGTNAQLGPVGAVFPQLGPASHKDLMYGAQGSRTAAPAWLKALQMDSTVFIGMVDDSDEDQEYEGSPTATFTITGRDLTKIFLDNDTYLPYSVLGGGPDQPGLANLGNIVVKKDNSGTALLLNVLDIFCKKDANAIATAQAETQTSTAGSDIINQITQYGYPWDKFVDQTQLNDAYETITGSQAFPSFSVQQGSVWANVSDLRNTPIGRLYVNEIGQLIYDDQYNAWTNTNNVNPTRGTIEPGDIRRCKFMQTDEDMLTVFSIIPAIAGMADTEITALAQVGAARTPVNSAVIQHYGYRSDVFHSQWDTASDPTTIAGRFKTFWLARNSMWRCMITVRGDSKFRVGTRWKLNTGGANSATQFKTWYIVNIQHMHQFGSDDTTMLELRYPM